MGSSQSRPLVCNHKIPGGLSKEKIITIEGEIPPDAVRFAINLVCDDERNIAFHFNPRFDGIQMVVCNTMKNGWWGAEQRNHNMPFVPGKPFKVTITANDNGYQVSVHDKHYYEYCSGLPFHQVQSVQLKGHVSLTGISITDLPRNTPEPSSNTRVIADPPPYTPYECSGIMDTKMETVKNAK